MIAAAFVAGGMRDGLTRALQPLELGSSLLGYRWPAAFTLLMVPLCASLGAAATLAAAIRRPFGRGMLSQAAIMAPLFCLAALFCTTEHRWDWAVGDVLERLGRAAPFGVPSLQTLKAGAANIALWIGYALAIAAGLGGMRGPSGAAMWRATIIAGSGASLAAIFGPEDSSAQTSGLNAAILIAAVTVLAGSADRKTYFASLIIAGLLAGGLTSLLEYRMKWLAPVLAVPTIFATQTAFTRPRSVAAWLADAALVTVTMLGAPYLQRPLLRVYDRISIAPDAILVAWLLAAGVLSARWILRKEIDRRLHLADRFACREWAVGPASKP